MMTRSKYYIDPTKYLDPDAVARQAQAVFPKIRFGVGPAALNANFDGDENLIVAHLSKPSVGAGTPAQSKSEDTKRFVPAQPAQPPPAHETSTSPEAIQYKDGDTVFIPSLGIEGKIKSVLPRGIVNVELADGITETMLAKNLEPLQRDVTSSPRPANDSALLAPAPPAAPAKTPDEASAKAPNDAPTETPAPGGEP